MKTIRKLSALLIFCAALLIGFGGTVHAEEAAGTKTVYITASTKSEMIIEPTAVTGREDQTVKELLAESGHEFAGLEDDGLFPSTEWPAITGVFLTEMPISWIRS